MKLSSNLHLKHAFGFQPLHSLHLLLELHGLKGDFLWPFPFIFCLKYFLAGREPPK